MKKLLSAFFALLIFASSSLACSALVLDEIYSPEKYINISGNYSAEEQSFDADSNEKIYKFNLSAGQTVLIDVTPALPDGAVSIVICDAEERTCAETPSQNCGADGRVMCGYTSKNGGEYYAKLTTESADIQFNIAISFYGEFLPIVDSFPYSSELPEANDAQQYFTYSFKLSAGDAFSLKTANSYSFILFGGNAGEFSLAQTKAYGEEFYGYCGIVADSSIATVFVPANAEGEISANVLAHEAYKIENVYLPLSGELNLSDAAIPFDEEKLAEFTADFGEGSIDNRPLKFFRFHQQPQQIIQITAEKSVFDSCSLVSGIDTTSPLSGRNRLIPLQQYDMIAEPALKENADSALEQDDEQIDPEPTLPDSPAEPMVITTANILTRSTGNYMLAVRDNGEGKTKVNVQAFEAFTLQNKFKNTYEYGEVIENISIKNIFVDTNNKDENGNLRIPYVSCIKLVDNKGNKSFYNVRDRIQPAADRTYDMFAVITDGETTYQVILHSFNVVDSSYEYLQTPEEQPKAESAGLSWWMIILIVIGVFCLACCLFLLLYKKDINEIE